MLLQGVLFRLGLPGFVTDRTAEEMEVQMRETLCQESDWVYIRQLLLPSWPVMEGRGVVGRARRSLL